jgi:AcrR family transcriptional regulator
MALETARIVAAKQAGAPPRARILRAARELFYRHGIHPVSVDAIAEAAETNKTTLYRHFESKNELVAECLRELDRDFAAAWAEIERTRAGQPKDQLLAWLRFIAEFKLGDSERGCTFANAAAELPDADHPPRRAIEEIKSRHRDLIITRCRARLGMAAAGRKRQADADDDLEFRALPRKPPGDVKGASIEQRGGELEPVPHRAVVADAVVATEPVEIIADAADRRSVRPGRRKDKGAMRPAGHQRTGALPETRSHRRSRAPGHSWPLPSRKDPPLPSNRRRCCQNRAARRRNTDWRRRPPPVGSCRSRPRPAAAGSEPRFGSPTSSAGSRFRGSSRRRCPPTAEPRRRCARKSRNCCCRLGAVSTPIRHCPRVASGSIGARAG